jgi:predicted Ser/Thr protein kinase
VLTPDDLALAESLLKSGAATAEHLFPLLRSLVDDKTGRRLSDLLQEEAAPSDRDGASYARTMAPGGASHDRTLVPGESARSVPAAPVANALQHSFGRYVIVGEIARGGMGIVYRAHEPGLKRDVALKVMLAGEGATEEQVERFLREARSAAALQHPNIVQVYDVGREKGMHYFAMEFVEGRALDRMLKEEGALPARLALRIVRDLARALQYAHDRGIIHRDIKPGNVLLAQERRAEASMAKSAAPDQRNFRVLLSDFGLAKEVSSVSNLTMSGNLIGTPAYMSPEQAAGRVSAIDARSDVYSLGAVAYEILTGKVPFAGSTLAEVLTDIRTADPPSMRGLRPELHRDVETIVMKAMAKEKERRYGSAEEMADDIERYLNGEAILAAAPTLWYRATKFSRRHWAGVTAAAVSLAVLTAAGGLTGWKTLRDRRERREAVARHVSEARRLIREHDAKKLQEAQVELNSALALDRNDPDAEKAQVELRLESLLVGVDALVAAKNWDGARAVLDSDTQFRGEPRVIAVARKVAGVSTIEIGSAEAGVEVDLVEPEPFIYWDEETFPSVRGAREVGICRPLGTAPIARHDLRFGEYLLVFSRNDAALMVLPIRVPRWTDVTVRFTRVSIDGPGPEDAPSLDAVLDHALPGTLIELAGGVYPPPRDRVPPGVQVRARRTAGGAPEDVLVTGSATLWNANDSHGGGLRDIAFRGSGSEVGAPASSGVAFHGAFRPSVIRCRMTDFTGEPAAFGECKGALVRDCEFARTQSSAFAEFSGEPGSGGLILMCHASDMGWQGISSRSPGGRIIRCRVERGTRAGIFCSQTGVEVSECVIRDCPEWGIVMEHAGSVIRDNLITGCGSVRKSQMPAAIVADGSSHCVHNTVIAPKVHGIVTFYPGASSAFLDNIVVDGGSKGFHVHDPFRGWQFDYNLFFNCALHCGITELDCPTLEDTRRAVSNPVAKSDNLQNHGMDCDPRFVDPLKGLLAADSPARGAASDGTDIGARVEEIARDQVTSAQWIVRDIARQYAKRGLALLRERRTEEAALLARKALFLAPDEPFVRAFAAEIR